jgi:asparagine synthetase B (glutamine-hydrolysing)
MPGAVGILRVDGRVACVSAALNKLLHFPTYYSKNIYCTESVALGVVADRPCTFDWHYDLPSRTGVLLIGTMIGTNPRRHVLDAREVFHEYQLHGFTRWYQFEGGFIAVILDISRDRLFLANDRLGQLPFYYGSRPGVFAFAPEVKGVLVHDGFEAHLSTPGIINFLSAGYCFGDLTLFENVNALEPSTLLSVDLGTLAFKKTRLWKMIYEPAPELRLRRVAEDELFESILEAHKTTLCDGPARVALLLSAGWDSRGMLAFLNQLCQLPKLAITWGLPNDIERSDVSLARSLAETFKVPFVFIPYTSDTFVDNAAHWCYLSELVSDNFSWCSQGTAVLSKLAKESIDVLLVGDHGWGVGGYVVNEMQARESVFAPELPATLQSILQKDLLEDAKNMYEAAVSQISAPCGNSDFVDRKDFMFLHGRSARFLMPIRSQYRKEFAMLLRRPFLSNGVLETVRRLPHEYRIYKNLYVSMLRRRLPEVMGVPITSAHSTPDWAFDIRRKEKLKSFFLELLDFNWIGQTPLGQVLDRQHFERLRDEFFNDNACPIPRRSSWAKEWKNRLRVAASRSPVAARMIRSVQRTVKEQSGTANAAFNTIRRIALIGLLQKHLNEFEQS